MFFVGTRHYPVYSIRSIQFNTDPTLPDCKADLHHIYAFGFGFHLLGSDRPKVLNYVADNIATWEGSVLKSNRIMFHADTGELIENENHTATVRYKTYDADEVEVGDVADAVLPDGDSFASLRITRTAVLPVKDAVDMIAAFGEQYPSESTEQLVERLNRYYEPQITADTTVRVITFEKISSDKTELDSRNDEPTLEDYKERLRNR